MAKHETRKTTKFAWFDGSGDYSAVATAGTLTLTNPDGPELFTLNRYPDLDSGNWQVGDPTYADEFELVPGFGWCDVGADAGFPDCPSIAWINGRAYSATRA